jgi:benzoate-CoA ligase
MIKYNCLLHLEEISKQLNTSNSIAIIDNNNSISYDELYNKSKKFGISLLNTGLVRKQHLLLCLDDSIDFVVCFLGCLYSGIIPIVVNQFMSSEDINEIISKTGINDLICSSNKSNQFNGAWWNLFLTLGNDISIDSFIQLNYNPNIKPHPTNDTDDAFILCTSGTTGNTKLVIHSQKSICGTGLQFGTAVLKINQTDIIYSASKMSHAYGLGNSISIPLTHGAKVILESELASNKIIAQHINTNNVTIFCGIPKHFVSLLDIDSDLISLQKCLSAGEALPSKANDEFTKKYNIDIIDAIGSTELLGFAISNGDVIPGVDIKLLNEYGVEVNDGEIGELYVKSEYSSLKYHNDDVMSNYTFKDNWIKTNDMYRKEDDKYIYRGRRDDCVKVNGLYVSLFCLEKELYKNNAILESAIVSTENKHGLNKIEIFVVLKDGYDQKQEYKKLYNELRKVSLMYKRPYTIKIVESLPRTATGKIKKYILLDGK